MLSSRISSSSALFLLPLFLSLSLLPLHSGLPVTFSECTAPFGPLAPSNSSLFVHWFNNTVFAPLSTSLLYQTNSSYSYAPSLTFHFPTALPPSLPASPSPFSFQVHGHLVAPSTSLYSFLCAYDNSTMLAMLWVDDHLLCPTDANNVNQSIHATAGQLLHVRAEVIQRHPWTAQLFPHFEVRWRIGDLTSEYANIAPQAMSACLSTERVQQMALHQRQLQTGWDAVWDPDLMTPTLLPHGVGLQVALYRISTHEFRGNFTTERAENGTISHTLFRIGNRTWVGDPHPFLSFSLTWAGLTVSVTSTSDRSNGSLTHVITAEGKANFSDYRLILFPQILWGRGGNCSALDPHSVAQPFSVCSSPGMSPDVSVYANEPVDGRHYAGINETFYRGFVGFRFPAGASPRFVLTTGVARDARTALSVTTAAYQSASFDECVDASLVPYSATPPPTEQCNLIQATLAWLTEFTPYEGMVLVVSRRWDFGFGYVLFEWDSFFSVTMLTSLQSPLAKELLVSTYLQVVKSRTITPDGLGFIPNYVSGTIASRDRTEPPIAARVLLELVRVYGPDDPALSWLVPLCFDDLWVETRWFWEHRRVQPARLIGLGSDPNPPIFGDIEYNDMQAARYESGLDNSPMYDDDRLFNNVTHLMEQYDVGMTALFLAACDSLIALSNLTGIGADAVPELSKRYAEMSALAEQLWDDRQGLYVNVRAKDGAYSRRLSPTSFFPMIAGLPSVPQAETMVLRHLQNPSEFCVTAECPGLPVPSIARNDLNYTDQSYWRGRQWGPHTMLVWWGLTAERYAGSAVIAAARRQLARQVDEIWKDEWRTLRHVHENYDGDTAAGCNTGNSDPLYSWGALNPYVAILEWAKQAGQRKAQAEVELGQGWRAALKSGLVGEGLPDGGPTGLFVLLAAVLLIGLAGVVVLRRDRALQSVRHKGRRECASMSEALIVTTS